MFVIENIFKEVEGLRDGPFRAKAWPRLGLGLPRLAKAWPRLGKTFRNWPEESLVVENRRWTGLSGCNSPDKTPGPKKYLKVFSA